MSSKPLIIAAVGLVLSLVSSAALASFGQQGDKLVGTGVGAGNSEQGTSVAVSADGSTAVVGAFADHLGTGAAWVYRRNDGVWAQEGAKLVGTGAVGGANQGISVAVSADGNTAVVGGYLDNSATGAAWVFTRSGGVWSQQGSKLVGTGAVGAANQGYSVALSADGNTAIVGGYTDNGNAGAAWVFTRSGGVWTQQGTKRVGTGAVGPANQGIAVALSGDGNTALVGGYNDNSSAGAAWVYTRSGGVWTQQGAKLFGTGAAGIALQGVSVALSGNGNTGIVGGYADNVGAGAAWVFTRSGSTWSQQGAKLFGTGAVGPANQGVSVSVSGDGNTAVVGGYLDHGFLGATWVYKRSGSVWSQYGAKLVGSGNVGAARQGYSVPISADGKCIVLGGYIDNNSVGAAWVFVEASPAIVAIGDIPNDQGGKLNIRWTASALDHAPGYNPIEAYYIWRQAPAAMALRALASGATLVGEGVVAGEPLGRVFRTTTSAAQVFYWEYVGSQVSHGFPAYSYTATTLSDSVPGSNPYTIYMVEAERLSWGEYWSSAPDSGYSVDNLPPGPPAPVAAVYSGGATHLSWSTSMEADFSIYRLYRGGSAGFVPGPGNLVVAQVQTSYVDVGAAGSFYKLSAVDVHGNESAYTLATGATTDVNDGGSTAFALERLHNPSVAGRLRVSFSLPSAARAMLEVVDVGGRRAVGREVGTLGPGRHTVDLVAERRLLAGVYFVRLTQSGRVAITRVTVLD